MSHTSEQNIAFDKILSIICKIEGVDSAGLYIVNQKDKSLELVSHLGFSDQVKYYPSDSINAEIVNRGEISYKNIPHTNYKDNIKSFAIVPIHYNNKAIGCLNLASHTNKTISSKTKKILESISLILGGAVLRIQSENYLKESQENFLSLFNSIDDFLFILDDDGNVLEVNSIVRERLGYSDEEIRNMNVLQLHPKDKKENVKFIIKKMLEGNFDSCPIPLVCKNGTFIEVETKVVRGVWNHKNALFGINRDISERLKYEYMLHRKLEQQMLLSDISQKLNFIHNFDESMNYIIEKIGNHTNVSRVYIFEDNEDSLSTSNTYEWCNVNIEPQIKKLQNIKYSQMPSFNKILLKNGKIFSNNIQNLPIDIYKILEPQSIKSILILPLYKQNKIFGFIGFDECLQNREWTSDEIELLKTISNIISNTFERIDIQNKLSIANETKDKFFSIIAHDLRGSIGNLMQISELLFEEIKDGRKISKKIINSQRNISKNTFNLLENLLNWARYNNEQIDYEPIKLNITEVINYNIEYLKYQAECKNISIIFDCDKIFECYADENMVDLVIRNILSNAIKFSKKNGKINIYVNYENEDINVKIIDNGVGIKINNIKKILSESETFTTHGTSNEKGNGLGLKLCIYFIEMNNGTFSIESKVGKGTTISFSLKRFLA